MKTSAYSGLQTCAELKVHLRRIFDLSKNVLVVSLLVLAGLLTGSMGAQCTPEIVSNNSLPPTSFYGNLTVSIGTDQFCTPGPIYYTVDGSTPSSSSPLYAGPFMITQTTTVKATYGSPAAVETGVYTLLPTPLGSGPGFTPGRVQLNGGAALDGANLMLTSATIANEASSAFVPTPVNVNAFTTDFTYFINNGSADGFMFVIQNQGPSALGAYGQDLGYGPGTGSSGIQKSVGVKFDIYNNAGEGNSSIGLYTNGARPTIPAISTYGPAIDSSGVSLSGYAAYRHVHMVYDGTTLTVRINDETLLSNDGFAYTFSFTYSFPVDIPSVVGGNTAYVGFTAGTGGVKSNQEIIYWNFQPGNIVAAPVFSLPGSPYYSAAARTYNGPQTVSLSSATPGATIYYTLDGSIPTTSSPVYSGPLNLTSALISGVNLYYPVGIDLRAVAVLNGVASKESDVVYQIDPGIIDNSGGITAGNVALNGSAFVTGGVLRLTDGGPSEAGSAWSTTQVGVHAFTSDFTFQLTDPGCCGIALVFQNQGFNALGPAGFQQGLPQNSTSTGITFALSDATGKVMNATQLVYGDKNTFAPAVREFTQSGVDLHSGHPMHVHMTYDGEALIYRVTDTVTKASSLQAYAPSEPYPGYGSYTGITHPGNSDVDYVGFTGSTDVNGIAIQDVLNWSYTAGTPVSAPNLSPAPGTYHTSMVTLADTTAGAQIYYTLDGSEPTVNSTLYNGPITIPNSNTTVTAVAIANGLASQLTSGTYTSNVITLDQSTGFGPGSVRLNGSATLSGTALQLTANGITNQAGSAFAVTPVNVQSFMTDFDFQLNAGNSGADGFMFVLQGQGPTALGSYGANLGFGGATPISKSVGIKFDIYNNVGEGSDSTGMYVNGAQPTTPSSDLTPYNLLLSSGRVLHAHLVYDGKLLSVTLTDPATLASATQYYRVNIPNLVGGPTAYVGFTGGTGGLAATQQILNWSYNAP